MLYTEAHDSALAHFLSTAGDHALLTKSQEQELGKQIMRGNQAQVLLEVLPSSHPQRALFEQMHKIGKQAQDELVQHNIKLVVNIAKKYGRYGELNDLIQEGNMGLMKAAEKFDYNLGHRFTTYATWWIRQAVTRYIHNYSRTIRLPVHFAEKYARMMTEYDRLRETNGGVPPTNKEVANALGWSEEVINHLLSRMCYTRSMDVPIGDSDDLCLKDTIVDNKDVEDHIAHMANQQAIRESFALLNERERFILTLRFGLDGNECHTLDKIGVRIGLTRERVRQLSDGAMKKIREQPGIKWISE